MVESHYGPVCSPVRAGNRPTSILRLLLLQYEVFGAIRSVYSQLFPVVYIDQCRFQVPPSSVFIAESLVASPLHTHSSSPYRAIYDKTLSLHRSIAVAIRVSKLDIALARTLVLANGGTCNLFEALDIPPF